MVCFDEAGPLLLQEAGSFLQLVQVDGRTCVSVGIGCLDGRNGEHNVSHQLQGAVPNPRPIFRSAQVLICHQFLYPLIRRLLV
uniref:Uncharacterized protein n=1 Tax=Anguilla anguilla TaxID=7936 RepID=A0A0E9WFA1_ANGAN